MHLLQQPSHLLMYLDWLCLHRFHEDLLLTMHLRRARRQLIVMRPTLLLSLLLLKVNHPPGSMHLNSLQLLVRMLQLLVPFLHRRADQPRLDLLLVDTLQQQDLGQEQRSHSRKQLLRHPNIVSLCSCLK